MMPFHCLRPIAAQLATVWSKSRLTLPLVTKLFITNFEHLALLLVVLPSVTTLEFGRYTRPSALKLAPGPHLLSVLVNFGSWNIATPCQGLVGSIGGDKCNEAA